MKKIMINEKSNLELINKIIIIIITIIINEKSNLELSNKIIFVIIIIKHSET